MSGLLSDLKYAVRMLKKTPGFTLIAVGMLALGIGATTVIFTGIESFLLRPMPVREPESLVMVQQVHRANGATYRAAYPDYLEWKKIPAFEHLSALSIDIFNVTTKGEPQRVRGSRVTSDFFAVLGVAPQSGRTFTPDEDRAGSAPVVVLGHSFWLREFGGSADALRKTLMIDGQAHAIVGVMPASLRFPGGFADLWVPLRASGDGGGWGNHYLAVIGRIANGVTRAETVNRLEAVARRLEEVHPGSNKDLGIHVVGLAEHLSRGVKRALTVLFVTVVFVLLLCCANIANLMLAKATHRSREVAIRMAVGAGRWRVLRQLLAESILLAVSGGVAGMLIAAWGVEMLARFLPDALLPMGGLSVNMRVLAFNAAVSVATGILFGLAPALRLLKPDTVDALRDSGKAQTGSGRGSRLSGALVIGEIAVAALLLVGSGLLIQAMRAMQDLDLGYNPSPVLTAELSVSSQQYPDPMKRALLFDELLRRLNATPGIVAASAVNWPPMTNDTVRGYAVQGRKIDGGRPPVAGYRIATPLYAKAMSIPMLKGRFIDDTDRWSSEPVAVVSEQFAKREWPGEDPIGKQMAWYDAPGTPGQWRTVVGVAGNIRHAGPAVPPAPEVYIPFAQQPQGMMYLVLRAQGDPAAMARTLETAARQIYPDLPLALVRPMERVIADGLAPARFTTNLLSLLSAASLILAAMGLYGLMSYLVARRVHEFGIRLALGATNSDLLRLVLRRSVMLTAIGTAAGALGGFGISRVLSSVLFEVRPTPAVFLAVFVLLALTAILSAWIPLRRAMALGPMNALRDN